MATKAELEKQVAALELRVEEAQIQAASAFQAMQEMARFYQVGAGLRIVMNVVGERMSVLVMGHQLGGQDAATMAAVFTRTLARLHERPADTATHSE